MGVNSLPKTVTRQRRDCDLNPGPTAPESSTLATRLPSRPVAVYQYAVIITAGGMRRALAQLLQQENPGHGRAAPLNAAA